jgi:PQQ-dependent dehydrogenase (methanol/ethanol family)
MMRRSSTWTCAAAAGLMAVHLSAALAQSDASLIAPPRFGEICSLCHGGSAEGTDRAPSLLGSRRLRGQSQSEIAAVIRNGRGNMPAFPSLPDADIQGLARFLRSLNAEAFDVKPAGDAATGSRIFDGSGHCTECHTAEGRGGINGPDLSSIARQLTLTELAQAIQHPASRIAQGYRLVDVTLRNGAHLRGFARSQGSHSVDLQTLDGQLHLLTDQQYVQVRPSAEAPGPAFNGSPEQLRDLMAFLSTLGGISVGARPAEQAAITPAAIDAIVHPKPQDWPTYSGNVSGNRYSDLAGITTRNIAALRPAWIHPIAYDGLETTPVVIEGVMYVTAPNQVFALDGRTGAQIWSYTRPRSSAADVSGDAAKGAQRGVAVLGERLYFITDDAHLICLHRLTGAVLWDVKMPEQPGKYGGTGAPLVSGDLVIAGVSGGDEGIRGFVAAYHATTGEQAWRFSTVPKSGDTGAETWQGDTEPRGGSSWTTGSYDARAGVLYWSIGNPYPDTDGDNRGGDNLYTDSDVALDAKTGKLLWYFQFTPHDVHDWDANQPLVLIDTRFQGSDRKLLLHANRNGFFYVLDRTNGKLLQASALVKRLTWATGIGSDGRPVLTNANQTTIGGVKTCPAVRGATNWYSTAFNPATQLYYVMTTEDCSIYRKAHDGGYGFINDPTDPPSKVLRAIAVDSGKIVWEVPLIGPVERNYSGVLTTAGGLVFFGETSGGFAAVDARDGHYLWHFECNQPWKASPMTYAIDGRQYIAIASGPNILSFALAGDQ